MSSLSAQVARAHARWLEPGDLLNYSSEEIEEKCKSITRVLENFAEEYCGEIEESCQVKETIKATEDLIKTLRSELSELTEMENNREYEGDYL